MKRAPAQAVLRHVAPGRSAMALLRPLGAAMASPSQVRCMHVDWKQSEEVHLHLIPNEKPLALARGFHLGSGNVLLSRAFGHGFIAPTGRRHGRT